MAEFRQSTKLNNVLYDIRGPILQAAQQMEAEGHRILKLNIGNPAPFGFEAPDAILVDMIRHLPHAQGYSDSRGIFSARTAVSQYYQTRGIQNIHVDDIYLGNGVSELITMSLMALLDDGDEVLIPTPDYPLWTASVALASGKPVHYLCDEESGWQPDLEDMEAKITPRTKGIVVINPNNPTGAVYPEPVLRAIADLARKHDLVIFADEIYEKVLFEGVHVHAAAVAPDLCCVTFSGLSKAYRVPGYRAGWLVITGPRSASSSYREGLELLASLRLCANVPAQHAIQTALGGYQSIDDLVSPGGRLRIQRDLAHNLLNDIPGLDCVQANGALYLFVRIDQAMYAFDSDEDFALELLHDQKLLVTHGSAFNWFGSQYFRFAILPTVQEIQDAAQRLRSFLTVRAVTPASGLCKRPGRKVGYE